MTDTTEAAGGAEEQPRSWRPSLKPDHSAAVRAAQGPLILEQTKPVGVARSVALFLRRPFVKLLLGLIIFLSAAASFEAFVNNGAWSIKADPPKATRHRGMKGVPKTPG